MGKTDSYNKCDDLCKLEHLWIPIGKKGSKECAWVHISDIPYFKQMDAKIRYYDGFFQSFGELTKLITDKNGIKGTKSAIGNLYKLIMESQIIFNGNPINAVETIGGLVTNAITNCDIIKGELPKDILKGYTRVVDNELVVDEELKQAYLNTLG